MAERHHRFLTLCSSFLTVYRLYICFKSMNVLLLLKQRNLLNAAGQTVDG
jgi:hypothetical protein